MIAGKDQIFLALGDHTSISYTEADRLTAKLANRLISWDIKAGDRITVQAKKSPQLALLYLACLRSGIVFHPLNTAYTLQELEYFLNDAQPSLLVCDPSRVSAVEPIARRCQVRHIETLDASGQGSITANLEEVSASFDIAVLHGDSTALLVYTSGTTGQPKGAMITHRNLQFNAEAMVEVWQWQRDDILLHVLPLFHVHGLCFAIHCPMMAGSRIAFESEFSVERIMRRMSQATAIMAVPTIYTRLLSRTDFGHDHCRRMRLFISGSAPLQPETYAEFKRRTGHRIVERYGMTEAQIITSNRVDTEPAEGSVGYPLPGVELRITGKRNEVLGAGEAGMLQVRGPNVFGGYWQKAESSAAAFTADGFFITGDIATIDNTGAVSIVGRDSDMIVAGGFNIYPKEIELQLNAVEGIVESAVFGVPHPDLGEAVVAALVTDDPAINAAGITAKLKHTLSAFKIPQKFIMLEQLPRNAMGKVKKNSLRQRYQNILT